MAIGTQAALQIYEPQFYGGMVERLMQATNAFGRASSGAIRLIPQIMSGQYLKESFFQQGVHVARRDPTSVAASTPTSLAQGEHVSVKLERRYEVMQTRDSMRKIGQDPAAFSLIAGQQIGKEVVTDWLNTGIIALAAAIPSDADHEVDVSATDSLETDTLVSALRLFGDAAESIVCWLVHSHSRFNLLQSQITANITDVTGRIMRSGEGSEATLDRRLLVTDSPALVISGAPDKYISLGLTEGALQLLQSQEEDVLLETVGGLENLAGRLQGEYAFTAKVKGHSWDIGAGGANPDATALGTGANWSETAADVKSTAGVRILTL